MAETDSSGALAQTHHQDAFGNTQASWSTGLWGGDKPGWHHNTKEYDGDIGLVYMYSRFYNAETGTFASAAPYPPMVEQSYDYSNDRPGTNVDPDGRIYIPILTELCIINTYMAVKDIVFEEMGPDDKLLHCALGCIIGLRCGGLACPIAAGMKEHWDDWAPGGSGYNENDAKATRLGCGASWFACSYADCFESCKNMRDSGVLPPNEWGK